MMSDNYIENIRAYLFSKQDEKYRDFTIKLIPNIDENSIIGVRTNILRAYAKEIRKDEQRDIFLNDLPHKYYEENNLHAFIIEKEKDYDKLIYYLDQFLPYINNWSTCDSLSPVVFKKEKEKTKAYLLSLLESEEDFIRRFAVVTGLKIFIKDELDMDLFKKIMQIESESYYLNMGVAWYMSYAIIHHFDFSIKYLKDNQLSDFVYKMSIQKAIDSRQLDNDKKDILREMRKLRS